MAAQSASDPVAVRTAGVRPLVPAPVIVASRGDAASDGALELALAMAATTGCGVRLIAAIEGAADVATELGAISYVPHEEVDGQSGMQRAIDAQLKRLNVRPKKVAVDIRTGDPASVVIRAAREARAGLVLLGASEHRVLERVFGADTAVRVARAADVPVLVVPRTCSELPTSLLIAVDFSDESVRAGRAALALFPDPEAVHLVHVAPSPQPAIDLVATWEGQYVESAERAFEKVRYALPLPTGTVVGRHIVQGNPARELLRVARLRRADLIVAGSHGHGALKRLFVGSVATDLLREAVVPVLILPAGATFTAATARMQPFVRSSEVAAPNYQT